MSLKINSSIIGELSQDKRFSDWWLSSPITIPFFDNKKLAITFTGLDLKEVDSFMDDANKALDNFLKLRLEDKYLISGLAYDNCMDFLDMVGYDEADDDLRQLRDKNEIWNYIHPTAIYVQRRHRRDEDMYVQVACECDWEEEHGLQLVFRQGKKLTRISSQDGHLTEADAYNIPDEKDELLSKF